MGKGGSGFAIEWNDRIKIRRWKSRDKAGKDSGLAMRVHKVRAKEKEKVCYGMYTKHADVSRLCLPSEWALHWRRYTSRCVYAQVEGVDAGGYWQSISISMEACFNRN